MPILEVGDVVRVIDDIAKVFQLQKGHGEWSDDMALVSGHWMIYSIPTYDVIREVGIN